MKKEREVQHLLAFKEKTFFFPKGKIEFSEKPDFLVRLANYIIGIEHTEIFQPGPSHGGSIQAQESLQQRIIEHAKGLYLVEGTSSLHIRVFFQPGNRIGKNDVASIAHSLFKIVKQSIPESGKFRYLSLTSNTLKPFPRGIDSIYIYHSPFETKPLWDFVSSGFVPKITKDDLQKIINKKDAKLHQYKEKCSEIWLLITAADLRISSTVDLSSQAAKNAYQTKFDRVFVFWYFSGDFIELKLAS